MEPDTATYSLVARAWSRSWRRTGAVPVIADAKTGEVIRLDYRARTTQTYRRCLEAGLQPDASMLRSLISVYCRDRSKHSLEAAEALLIDQALSTPPATSGPLQAKGHSDQGQRNCPLHPSLYSQMARAWQAAYEDNQLLEGGAYKKKNEGDDVMGGAVAASRNFMEKLIRKRRSTEHPQQLYIAWNLQLAALAECALVSAPYCERETVRQAEDIFDMMINSQIQHAERVERSEQKLEHEQGFLRADTVTMNLVLEVLGKTLPSSSTSTNDILEKCDQILTKGELHGILPNTYTFQIMLEVWRHYSVGDLPSRAQALFDRVLSVTTDKDPLSSPSPSHTVMFSSLLEIWSNVNPRHAADILDRMIALGMSPPPACYAQLMEAWSRVGNGEMCEEVLLSAC